MVKSRFRAYEEEPAREKFEMKKKERKEKIKKTKLTEFIILLPIPMVKKNNKQ